MKRFLAFAMVITVVLSIVGCSTKKSSSKDKTIANAGKTAVTASGSVQVTPAEYENCSFTANDFKATLADGSTIELKENYNYSIGPDVTYFEDYDEKNSNDYPYSATTSRGLKIGDSIETLALLYPEVSVGGTYFCYSDDTEKTDEGIYSNFKPNIEMPNVEISIGYKNNSGSWQVMKAEDLLKCVSEKNPQRNAEIPQSEFCVTIKNSKIASIEMWLASAD